MHSRAQHPHHLPWRLCGRQRSQDSLWKPGSTPPPPSCQQPRGTLMKQLGVVVFLPGVPVLHCCPGKPREYQASLQTSFLCSHLRLLPTEGVSPPGHWHIMASISTTFAELPKNLQIPRGQGPSKKQKQSGGDCYLFSQYLFLLYVCNRAWILPDSCKMPFPSFPCSQV